MDFTYTHLEDKALKTERLDDSNFLHLIRTLDAGR
jgi:hypothetical protein